jgi:predicted aspartyl protease
LADTHAYTYRIQNSQWRSIIIPVNLGISAPFMYLPQRGEFMIAAKALIDTGATGSCVSDSFAQKMRLPVFTQKDVYSVHGRKSVPVYCLDILLPNGSVFKGMKVSEFHKSHDFDFIIGMNILRLGDMAITNANNETVFSFRIPSGCTHIDFSIG